MNLQMNLSGVFPRSWSWMVVAALLALPRVVHAVDDEWPQYGHDRALTGRTALKGDIENPREAWSVSLSGKQLELEVQPSIGEYSTKLDDAPFGVKQRSTAVAGAELVDDKMESTPNLVDRNDERWASILPGKKKLQRITWSQTGLTAANCRLQLFSYEEGYDRPKLEWESDPVDTVMSPLCVVYDIDHDGVQEICVTLHFRVLVFEGTTGRKETELQFHSARSYGWFGLANVDDDEPMELVVLADFQSHFDVLDYRPDLPEAERLSVKWRRDLELDIGQRQKWPQIGPRPIVDVMGDERPEIVLNLFNDHGDEQWHVVVLDASSGAVLRDLSARYTVGTADVDADGKDEVLCASTAGALVPRFGEAQIIQLKDGEQILWSKSSASFGLADLPKIGPIWASGAADGLKRALISERDPTPAFLVVARDSIDDTHTTVSAIRLDENHQEVLLWQVSGLPTSCETLSIAKSEKGVVAGLRVTLSQSSTLTAVGRNASASIVSCLPLGTLPFAPIAARLTKGGPVDIVAQGAAESVFCIRAPQFGNPSPEIRWQRPGHGIGDSCNPGTTLAVDLDDDGASEIVCADEAPNGSAVLKALHGTGEQYWQHNFDRIGGEITRSNNSGGLLYWWPGHFLDDHKFDLFVNTRRSLMHSDEGYLLKGATGEQVWNKRHASVEGKFHWGFGGAPVAVADVVKNGCDQIVSLYPVCFWVGDGASGEILVAQEYATRTLLRAWAAYGEPVVYDFVGDEHPEILLDSPYILAMLDQNGVPLWQGRAKAANPTEENSDETTTIRHAVLDFNGDGQMEIASGGYRDGVRAIDPKNGTVLWTLATPTPMRKCAAADINGDGGDELLFVAGSKLIAVTGDLKSGRTLWTWQGPADLSLPAIADVDGDGKAEIVVQSQDGTVHCIDGDTLKKT